MGTGTTDDPRSIVRDIITQNQYMSIATSDDGRPWVAPVQYCFDDELNLYFVSLPTSRHARDLVTNPTVSVAIFDSQQPPFTGRGVQIEGRAAVHSEVENPFATIGGMDMPTAIDDLIPGYVAYRVQSERFWVPRGCLEAVLRDERVEVEM